jgi:hypothetical protein
MSPDYNDDIFDLWLKIAYNFYSYAVGQGIAGLNPPSFNDKIFDLKSKTAYYTARLAS